MRNLLRNLFATIIWPKDIWLVVERKPITDLPEDVQQQLRAVYFKHGWAASEDSGQYNGTYYGIEYIGAFWTKGAAIKACGNNEGRSYTRVPFNSSLPSTTSQYFEHDFPALPDSVGYANRTLAYVAVPTARLRSEINEMGRRFDALRSILSAQDE